MSDKRQKIEDKIKEFVGKVLNVAEKEEKLDHLNMEISNHNGNLQMDYTLRDRERAY